MTNFSLQIVTPEREFFNAPVDSVTVPGMAGTFGVLSDHAPLIAALSPGLVEIVMPEGNTKRLFVGGGFFQVSQNNAMLLADSAELAADVDVARARQAEERASKRLAGQMEVENLQRQRAEAALERARGRIRVASGK
jgi:F-type H+-transporting ATPase subunit epsilon